MKRRNTSTLIGLGIFFAIVLWALFYVGIID